jgi:uncharacterized protein (DUF362 family)/Pyruvate/2-oxoacid:ferredoxin oxidoreductase delta subunit
MLGLDGNHIQDSSILQRKPTNKAKVSIVKAHTYDYVEVYEAVKKSIELLDTLKKLIKPSDKVFVKINHLPPPSPPERGIVTHPVFVRAVVELLKTINANITVGDDIDSPTVEGFQLSGIRQVCQEAGVRLINLRDAGFVETKCSGLALDKVYISKIVLDADVIINLPKFKTHTLAIFTGGVKNMYGTIPQGDRQRYHSEYVSNENFSRVLADVFSVTKPQLTIMDGVMAMQGEGPAAGTLRQLGVILASQDAVALDAVATKIIGVEPMNIPTTRYAHGRGLGIGDLRSIEVVGERIESVAVSDFKLPASYSDVVLTNVPMFLSKYLMSQMSVKLKVIQSKCTGCSECKKVCPTMAMSVVGKKARIDQSICIQCMCCHEACRFNAIMARRPPVGRLIGLAVNILRKH